MEWDKGAKIDDFQQAAYAKQAKLAPKLRNHMAYSVSDYADIDKLKLTIALPLYGMPAGQKVEENDQNLTHLFSHFTQEQQFNVNSIISVCLALSHNPADRLQVSKIMINTRAASGQEDVYVLRFCLENEDEKRAIGFADGDGRFYKDWKDFLLNNTLPKCFMVYPKEGKYVCSEQGEWLINGTFSAACSLRNALLEKTDMVCHLSSLALAGVHLGAYVLGLRLPRVVGVAGGLASIAVGAYSLLRSAGALLDKKAHGQPLSLKHKHNRQLWIDGGVGAIGLTSLAISSTIGKQVRCAAALGRLHTLSTIKCIIYNCTIYSSHFIFSTSLANFIYTLYQENRYPTLAESAHFSISLLFYYKTVVNMQTISILMGQANGHNHPKYPIKVGSSRGQRIAMDVQDYLISQISDQITELERRVRLLERGLEHVDTPKPIAPYNNNAAKDNQSLFEDLNFLEDFLKQVFGLGGTPSSNVDPSSVDDGEAFRASFIAPHSSHQYVKADYDPNLDIVSDFFEYEFGSENKRN